jgi:phospholipase/carboxylesterase
VGFGYSNGANILASVLFVAPSLFDAAVLLHPLIPFEPPAAPRLKGKRILITAGRRDPLCPPASTLKLSAYFEAQGANVALAWHEGGHEIRPEEVAATKRFVESLPVKAA